MKTLTSTEFRKQYALLKEDALVTVNGHPIGAWFPAHTPGGGLQSVVAWMPISEELLQDPPTVQSRIAELQRKLPGGGLQARQLQRDELLRKINRGKA